MDTQFEKKKYRIVKIQHNLVGGKHRMYDDTFKFVAYELILPFKDHEVPPEEIYVTLSPLYMSLITTSYYVFKWFQTHQKIDMHLLAMKNWQLLLLAHLPTADTQNVYTQFSVESVRYIFDMFISLICMVVDWLHVNNNFDNLEREYAKDVPPNGDIGHVNPDYQEHILEAIPISDPYFMELYDKICMDKGSVRPQTIIEFLNSLYTNYYYGKPKTFIKYNPNKYQLIRGYITAELSHQLSQIINRTTPAQDYGNGMIEYLDRHDITCPNGSSLSKLQLHRDIPGNKIFYSYNCVQNSRIGQQTAKSTSEQYEHTRTTKELQNIPILCANNETITGFHLARDPVHHHIRYGYGCAPIAGQLNTQTYSTQIQTADTGTIAYLDRHVVECPNDGLLKELKLTYDDKQNTIKYDYVCNTLL